MFVRGHLLSYARFIGVDAGEVVRLYERDWEPVSSPIEHLDLRDRRAKRPPRARWFRAAVMAAAVLIAVSAVGLIHGPGTKPAAEPGLGSLPQEGLSLAAGQTMPLDDPDQVEGKVPLSGGVAPVTLMLSLSDRSWVEVVADGRTVVAEVLPAGTHRTFSASGSARITLGNAGSATLVSNGEPVTLPAEGVWTETFRADHPRP